VGTTETKTQTKTEPPPSTAAGSGAGNKPRPRGSAYQQLLLTGHRPRRALPRRRQRRRWSRHRPQRPALAPATSRAPAVQRISSSCCLVTGLGGHYSRHYRDEDEDEDEDEDGDEDEDEDGAATVHSGRLWRRQQATPPRFSVSAAPAARVGAGATWSVCVNYLKRKV
jgi:hypothetical protein